MITPAFERRNHNLLLRLETQMNNVDNMGLAKVLDLTKTQMQVNGLRDYMVEKGYIWFERIDGTGQIQWV